MTTFRYWETDDPGRHKHQKHRAPGDRRGWNKLAQWNDGVGLSSRKQDNYDADVRRWVQTFGSQLELTEHQKSYAQYIVEFLLKRSRDSQDDFTLKKFGPRRPVEHVILGVITLVVDAETTDIDNWIVYRDDFESMMEDLELDRKSLWRIRKVVSNETDFFSTK